MLLKRLYIRIITCYNKIMIGEGKTIMPMTSKEMIKYLKKHGFIILRQKGTSHVQMTNPLTGRQTTLPYHSSKTLHKGLEQQILKQAGLK